MVAHPKFQITRLREIGWATWDPIGLGGMDVDWPADEYDSYLLHAAGQLWNGQPDEAVVEYLVAIETQSMGLTGVPSIRLRALEVVKAIREHVETLRA